MFVRLFLSSFSSYLSPCVFVEHPSSHMSPNPSFTSWPCYLHRHRFLIFFLPSMSCIYVFTTQALLYIYCLFLWIEPSSSQLFLRF
ncbi:hypothetical protein GYMLUDRAFT_466445 [Collybiopsis luxurians FD-317 M1]|uniref:Uncharacterized protein n=1 Tax=Collybiopsis luxurians FD-317 M1 TaxID=944289 RepID=A0A0D0CUX1_9AGAR|nr:hypothetical protein GYMLUDRAFT_466445 [Collybiopsis luxurians FD-317 M1]